MFVAGFSVPDRLVLELAHLVDDEELETKLRGAGPLRYSVHSSGGRRYRPESAFPA